MIVYFVIHTVLISICKSYKVQFIRGKTPILSKKNLIITLKLFIKSLIKLITLNLRQFKVVFNLIYDSNILWSLLLAYLTFSDSSSMFFEKIKSFINSLKLGWLYFDNYKTRSLSYKNKYKKTKHRKIYHN